MKTAFQHGGILQSKPYGRDIQFKCEGCGTIFHTKNIAPLGCRVLDLGYKNIFSRLFVHKTKDCPVCNTPGKSHTNKRIYDQDILNDNHSGCGWWSVCWEKACPCAARNLPYTEKTWDEFRKEAQREAESAYADYIELDAYDDSYDDDEMAAFSEPSLDYDDPCHEVHCDGDCLKCPLKEVM